MEKDGAVISALPHRQRLCQSTRSSTESTRGTWAWPRSSCRKTTLPCSMHRKRRRQSLRPLNNIRLENGKPVWGKHCTHCMACICYCPKEAIEYGKKSKGKPRYHFEALEKQQDRARDEAHPDRRRNVRSLRQADAGDKGHDHHGALFCRGYSTPGDPGVISLLSLSHRVKK